MINFFSYHLFKSIKANLIRVFPQEADPLAYIIVEYFSGYTKTEIITNKPFKANSELKLQIKSIIKRLLKNEPIQYILGRANFYNRFFIVNNKTFIPRQETEELVYLILNDLKKSPPLSILDIGTGTGCIPITLKLEAPTHQLSAIDISQEALYIANKNAKNLNANIKFISLDILKHTLPQKYDVIISNPPYVLKNEKPTIEDKVLNYEPPLALFVNNSEPLLFYKKIMKLATQYLNPNGKLYFEINEQFGKEISKLMQVHLFSQIKLHQDLNKKNRFVTGTWVK